MTVELVFSFILLLAAALYIVMIFAINVAALRKDKTRDPGKRIGTYFSGAQKEPKASKVDMVSVIIPVRNEISNIVHCLEDLSMQDYPGDHFEIIVSDDFSEDHTTDKVRKWLKGHPQLHLTLLEGSQNLPENHGKKKAIERAIVIAEGDLIITTDADTIHGKSWINKIVEAFRNQEVRMVLGPVGFTGEKGVFQKIQVLEFLGIMGITVGSVRLGSPLMCNGANLAYRKQSFTEAEGFSGNSLFHSGDDQFLMMKFRRLFGGKSIVFLKEKDAIVLTQPCSSWNDFWEQRLRWVSKSRGYRDPAVIAGGLLTFGFPFLILLGGIAGIFYPWVLLLSASVWFLKILVEYPLVCHMAGFFEKKHLLNYYFVAQVFQFFYTITVAIAGQFIRYSWKGRSLGR